MIWLAFQLTDEISELSIDGPNKAAAPLFLVHTAPRRITRNFVI